ncbi:hypothetical protein DENSPDRAFT_874439 [Dentipellis sp. KUC8613]|nr:hypothetical protein DENSPDRAFT_874439 [Dentipellis sp. KUC8613]
MAKGKSSASSATRKKHARKALGKDGAPVEPALPKEKKPKGKDGKGKGKNKEPRKKVYIAPVKPAPVQHDPLDALGLAHQLPPELLVVLRRLAKKDAVTKAKALEELHAGWIEPARRDSEAAGVLGVMLPVWLHHLPALLLHPARRIRALAANLHAALLRLPTPREQLLFFLHESATEDQAECILGSWAMAARDADRQVAAAARRSWDTTIALAPAPARDRLVLNPAAVGALVAFVQRAVLDPAGLYAWLNPVQVPVSQAQPKRVHGRAVPVKKDRDEEEGGAARQKGEGEEEGELDRKARLRIGGLGVVQWLLGAVVFLVLGMRGALAVRGAETEAEAEAPKLPETLVDMLASAPLWTALHHARVCPFADIESFGFGQPGVRTAAWALLQTLLQYWKAEAELSVRVLSAAVLRSAFVEPDPQVRGAMWQPLLTFLKDFPRAWEFELAFKVEKEAESESESEDEDEESHENHAPPAEAQTETPTPSTAATTSMAYQEFLQFLELGCSGSPLQGYPTVVIILSTIPSSILAQSDPSASYSCSALFTSFWAAIDGRALSSLERAATSAAFLASLLECTSFVVRRLRGTSGVSSPLLGSDSDSHNNADGVAQRLVRAMYARTWEEIAQRRLRVEPPVVGKLVAENLQVLERMDADADGGLFQAAWEAFAGEMRGAVESPGELDRRAVLEVLRAIWDTSAGETKTRAAAGVVVADVASAVAVACRGALIQGGDVDETRKKVRALADVVDVLGEILLRNTEITESIDDIVQQNSSHILEVEPSLLVTYLSRRADEGRAVPLWRTILTDISSHPDTTYSTLPPLVDAVQHGALPEYLRPAAQELDMAIHKLFADALEGAHIDARLLLLRVVQHAKFFVSDESFDTLLELAMSDFSEKFEPIIHGEQDNVARLELPLEIASACFSNGEKMAYEPRRVAPFLQDVCLLALLIPKCVDVVESPAVALARVLLNLWEPETEAGEKVVQYVQTLITLWLKDAVTDITLLPGPREILAFATEQHTFVPPNALDSILPDPEWLQSTLSGLRSDPAHSSLAITLPLVPPADAFEPAAGEGCPADRSGLGAYTRGVAALLYAFIDDRQRARANMPALTHLIALALYAEEFLQVPARPSPALSSAVAKALLHDVIAKVEQLTAYLVVVPSEGNWHANVVKTALGELKNGPKDETAVFLNSLIKDAQKEDGYLHSQIVFRVLQHVLGDATREEGDQWMLLVRKLEKSAPQLSLAILLAVTQFGPEPPRLERYRNELAANALGIPPSKANTEGLLLLRRLAVAAPDPESDVVFLPQPRAVNFMKACQQWIAADEDVDEDVQSELTLVFFHLVPILQNVTGAHWDLVFDVVENNLENASFNEDDDLTIIWRTVQVIQVVQDLVTYNKPLRATWNERQTVILTLLRDLVASETTSVQWSKPRSVCREAALSIVQNLPPSLMDHETLSKMSHLLSDPSIDVQKMAYDLLREAANKRTEHVVIESAVDAESTIRPELPAELVALLQQSIDWDYDRDESVVFGYMLSWMVTLDLFANASMKVRSGYIEHLRDLDLVSTRFIPMILTLLNLYGGISRSFKLDYWSVDEYYVQFYDPEDIQSRRLLAAHLYFRALNTIPSLIRSWLLDCKDRTLSNAVTTYTSHHFSPVIIKSELTHIKSPEAAELNVENMAIKVASNLNEVSAVYTIDEQQLELTLKIPTDWPLHGIEVKDSKRLGVSENRWRGWLLGVQQIVWSQNGHIVDAFSLFKKNVTLHFEGQVECAICYSIISVVDGDLPRKPCKTCKNRFHASCLFKWFNTSHSSSCPLCRSDIM